MPVTDDTARMTRAPSAPDHVRGAGTVLLLLAGLLAACGAGDHADADVTFAQQMIPHHRQAVQMAATHDAGPQVRALASEIESAQGPEIRTMTAWLRGWDEKVPSATSHGSMGGMMSDTAMRALGRARGDAFDRLFLTQMVEHHSGAVAMARKELADGASEKAEELASSVVQSQTAEIARMKRLLAAP